MKNIIQIVLVVMLITSCNSKGEKPDNKSVSATSEKPVETVNPVLAKNRIIAQKFYDDVVNSHNAAMLDSYATLDYVEHQYDTHFKGDLKGTKKAFLEYFTSFPDMHVKVNFMMAEGDLVT